MAEPERGLDETAELMEHVAHLTSRCSGRGWLRPSLVEGSGEPAPQLNVRYFGRTGRSGVSMSSLLKQPCSICGAMILPTTAAGTAGKCMPCFKGRPRRPNPPPPRAKLGDPSELRLEVCDLDLECDIQGYCPVQAYGTIRGRDFYFRAHHDFWSFELEDLNGVLPDDGGNREEGFYCEGAYWNASWMRHADAADIIQRCAVEVLHSRLGRKNEATIATESARGEPESVSMIQQSAEYVRSIIVGRLPRHVRWIVGETPVDHDFSRATRHLAPISPHEMVGDLEPEWSGILLFCEQDYSDGGGASPFLGVDAESWEVFGLDVERDHKPIFFLNTNIDAFVDSFLIMDSFLREGKQVPLPTLQEQLRAADPSGWPASDWRLLAEHLVELELER